MLCHPPLDKIQHTLSDMMLKKMDTLELQMVKMSGIMEKIDLKIENLSSKFEILDLKTDFIKNNMIQTEENNVGKPRKTIQIPIYCS